MPNQQGLSRNRTSSVRPAFILSLPRSGSTLLQRLLGAHPAISTHSEPWILLPVLYQNRADGVHTEYNHRMARRALADIVQSLPHGIADYQEAVRQYAMHIYRSLSTPNTEIFIDKTPRYSLAVRELRSLFPESRYLVLWRNPLAVLASCSRTWQGGKWRFANVDIELEKGLSNLVELSQEAPPNVLFLRYEDLVTNPKITLARVFDHLQVETDLSVINKFNGVSLTGSHGDHVGVRRYDEIATEPLERWQEAYSSTFRVWYGKRYLEQIGAEQLGRMGFSMSHLLSELDNLDASRLASPKDILDWWLDRTIGVKRLRRRAYRLYSSVVRRSP